MNQSKAGKKLNPLISDITTPIFRRAPSRYGSIARLIWRWQKAGWADEAIAEAFKLAEGHIDAAANWPGYVQSLLPKAKGRASEAESAGYKSEVGLLADEFVEFLKVRKTARAT
jgi:hypothetical protein